MENRILFVDDDQRFLSSLQRTLARKFAVTCAGSPQEALDLLAQEEFAVIVSDMKMPGLTGIELLSQAKETCPDMVRILFTGFADQQTAVEAINQGEIFRFLTKPCDSELLLKVLGAALRQHQLIIAERELLEKTVLGTIQTLSQILTMVNPTAQQRANRLKYYCHQLAVALEKKDLWFFEMAALLSQVGCLSVPDELFDDYLSGQEMSAEDRSFLHEHPLMAGELLRKIPRLEQIAGVIELQNRPYREYAAGSGLELEEKTALAAQILHLALELDRQLHYFGRSMAEVINVLKDETDNFNPEILAVLPQIKPRKANLTKLKVMASELTMSMTLCESIFAKSGLLLATEGQDLTEFLLIGIKSYAKKIGVNEPFTVLAPAGFVALHH